MGRPHRSEAVVTEDPEDYCLERFILSKGAWVVMHARCPLLHPDRYVVRCWVNRSIVRATSLKTGEVYQIEGAELL